MAKKEQNSAKEWAVFIGLCMAGYMYNQTNDGATAIVYGLIAYGLTYAAINWVKLVIAWIILTLIIVVQYSRIQETLYTEFNILIPDLEVLISYLT